MSRSIHRSSHWRNLIVGVGILAVGILLTTMYRGGTAQTADSGTPDTAGASPRVADGQADATGSADSAAHRADSERASLTAQTPVNETSVAPPAADSQAPKSTETAAGDSTATEVAANPAETEAGATANALLAQAREARSKRDPSAAQEYYQKALVAGLPSAAAGEARAELRELTRMWLFSSSAEADRQPLIVKHKVQSGESLERIARKYFITPDIIASINGLADPNQIRAGQTLRVVEGPFHVSVDRNTFVMDVFLRDKLIYSFNVGLGRNDGTPSGKWRVLNKLLNPGWTNPETHQSYAPDDPENPIGECWIGLEGLEGETVGREGFGIHGTTAPESIGRNESLGCIRLRNDDAMQVYMLLVPGRSFVYVN